MGYSTGFSGSFDLDKPLTKAHADYLMEFANTRRVARTPDIDKIDDPIRIAAGLPIGPFGAYYVGGNDKICLTKDDIHGNLPPKGQPGLWCQWIPDEVDNASIIWDGGEKFYEYVEWIEYLIEHFLQPWGYVVNGEMEWKGDDPEDLGKIVVENNKVKVLTGRVVYEENE